MDNRNTTSRDPSSASTCRYLTGGRCRQRGTSVLPPSTTQTLHHHLIVLIVLLFSCQTPGTFAAPTANGDFGDKSLKVCSVLGALELTRLTSSHTRNFFQSAIEDVELIREYLSEAMTNQGIVGGLHQLDDMAASLDAQARNLTLKHTTLQAGLAWTDDRSDRRIERYVSLANQPMVGSKQADMAMVDTVSNIFPWIVDRKSHESFWWLNHQNGRSEGATKPKFRFDQLYVAAWIGTYGEAWMYYPPLRVFGHPFTFPEILSANYDSHEEEFVRPNLPQHNPTKRAFFTAPYPDTAVPGLSLITAMAPVYYTGSWQGYEYNDTYMASTGVDIAVASVSSLLEELEGTLTEGSFAFLVDADFHVVVISQATVDQIYPQRTGMEESRVTYDLTTGDIASDRRNQTYLVSDTILQDPTNLTNANWTYLHEEFLRVGPGGRGYTQLNITLTNHDDPTLFYVTYERWPDVADWVLLTLAPVHEVDYAIDAYFLEQTMEVNLVKGEEVENEAPATSNMEGVVDSSRSPFQSVVLMNSGSLDVSVSMASLPKWIQLVDDDELPKALTVSSGTNLTLHFKVLVEELGTGTTSTLLSVVVEDDNYPDCFYSQTLSMEVRVKVTDEPELNQLGPIRFVAHVLGGLVVAMSLSFVAWVQWNSKAKIVKASQPFFLHMLCAGTLVMGLSTFPLGIDDEHSSSRACDVACVLFPWLFTMGFSVAFSALFSKIWRINKIVRAAERFKRLHVEPRDVMIPFLIIFSANVVLLTIWTILEPLEYERVETSDHESHGTCYSNRGATTVTAVVLLAVVNFGAVILANFEAYKARDLKVEYSESKYIGIAMGCMLQAFLLGVPLLFLVGDNPQAFTFLLSCLVFLISVSLLLLIFMPKVLYLRQNGDKPLDRRVSSSKMSFDGMSGSFSNFPTQQSRSLSKVPLSGGSDTASAELSRSDGLRITSVIVEDEKQNADEKRLRLYKRRISRLEEKLRVAEERLKEAGVDEPKLIENKISQNAESDDESEAEKEDLSLGEEDEDRLFDDEHTPVAENRTTESATNNSLQTMSSVLPGRMIVGGSYGARIAVSDLSYESQDFRNSARSSSRSSKNISRISGLESLAESPDAMPLYEDDEEQADESESTTNAETDAGVVVEEVKTKQHVSPPSNGPRPLYSDDDESISSARSGAMRRSTASRSSKSSHSTCQLQVIEESDEGAVVINKKISQDEDIHRNGEHEEPPSSGRQKLKPPQEAAAAANVTTAETATKSIVSDAEPSLLPV